MITAILMISGIIYCAYLVFKKGDNPGDSTAFYDN